jgi:hypothetical protein
MKVLKLMKNINARGAVLNSMAPKAFNASRILFNRNSLFNLSTYVHGFEDLSHEGEGSDMPFRRRFFPKKKVVPTEEHIEDAAAELKKASPARSASASRAKTSTTKSGGNEKKLPAKTNSTTKGNVSSKAGKSQSVAPKSRSVSAKTNTSNKKGSKANKVAVKSEVQENENEITNATPRRGRIIPAKEANVVKEVSADKTKAKKSQAAKGQKQAPKDTSQVELEPIQARKRSYPGSRSASAGAKKSAVKTPTKRTSKPSSSAKSKTTTNNKVTSNKNKEQTSTNRANSKGSVSKAKKATVKH